jgi:CheY-like chemotaxis protein
LLDGQSWEARLEAESPLHRKLKLFWIGPNPPEGVARAFERPILWPEVIEALDAVFAPKAGLDLDLDVPADSLMSEKQALIVSNSREQRLYLRARLSLARITLADEAESGAKALELAGSKKFDLALVDRTLADTDSWQLLRQLRHGPHAIQHVAMTQSERSLPERVRAWMGGAEALLESPPHPARLDEWLSRIELGSAG